MFSWNGHYYFIMFVKDYSQYGCVNIITKMYDALVVFKSFKARLKINVAKELKTIDLTIVVNIIVDMMNRDNCIRDLLPNF